MPAKRSADARLERLLVMVPWVSEQEGPSVEDVCRRFSISEVELAQDLELLFMCGLYPFTPDALMEADIVDGRVWIRFTEAFLRPPTFTRREAVSILAAGAAVADLPQNEGNTTLRSALSKLVRALGLSDEGVIDVELATAPDDVLKALQSASAEHRQVTIDYYSYGRDAWTRRRIAPYRVFNREGQWYAQACALEADEVRTFRVDRMCNLTATNEQFQLPDDLPEPTTYNPRPEDPVMKLRLRPRAHWVAEHYPIERLDRRKDDSLEVTLRVSEPIWLERLLLRLGSDATVVSGNVDIGRTARRLLRRYEQSGSIMNTSNETIA